jgi:two-component system NtrC family sensor kinase
LAVALSFGAAVILLAAGAWNLHLQRRHLTRLVEAQAAEMVEVVRGSTRQAMLENNATELGRMIDTVAGVGAIERVRVFDKQGRIIHSSDRGEVGRLVDRTAEQCVSCHAADRPLTHLELSERSRIFVRPGGQRVLGLIAPIHNEPACSNGGCHAHAPEKTILGVLDVQIPLGEVEASLAASQRQLLGGLAGTVLAVVLLTGGLTWRMVLRPVGRLTTAAPLLAGGDFSMRVPADSTDELGDLARAWNEMAAEIGTAHDKLSDWSRTLEERVREKTAEIEQTHQQVLRVEKMASLGKLAAVMAHELNNPLAGIATYAKLLRRRLETAIPEDTTDTARILKLVEDEAMRCGDIVRNLLLFSRTPGARFAEEALAPIVERCALLVRHSFQLHNVELRLDVPAGLRLECDASQIHQMLLALVMNALEGTPVDGLVTISACLDAEAGRVCLQVEDTGRGIPPELLDKIFEPFFTTKEQGAGVGLGLAVVYGIVERHHGTIDVSSTPGTGTVFRIGLPLRQSEATEASEGRA